MTRVYAMLESLGAQTATLDSFLYTSKFQILRISEKKLSNKTKR
jgi:hypothetical protein